MARYFVDTSCLIGMTFPHDSWYPDAVPLVDKGNSVYLSDFVLYEYCNQGKYDPPYVKDPDSLELSADNESGVFGKKVSELNDPLMDFEDAVEKKSLQGELSVEWVEDAFFDHFDFREKDFQAISDYFSDRLVSDRLSFRSVQQAARDLVDMVHNQASENKEDLLWDARILSSRYDEIPEEKERIENYLTPDHELTPDDMAIILDAIWYCKHGMINRIVTGDTTDMMPVQEALTELYGLSILHVPDEFANPQIQ